MCCLWRQKACEGLSESYTSRWTEGKMSAGLMLWISHQPLLLHAVSLQPKSYETINNTFITTSYHSFPSCRKFHVCSSGWMKIHLRNKRETCSSSCCLSFSLVVFFSPLFSIVLFPWAAIDFWRCSSVEKLHIVIWVSHFGVYVVSVLYLLSDYLCVFRGVPYVCFVV